MKLGCVCHLVTRVQVHDYRLWYKRVMSVKAVAISELPVASRGTCPKDFSKFSRNLLLILQRASSDVFR